MIKKRVNATRSAVGVRLSEISQGKRLWLSLILPFMCAAILCCAFVLPKNVASAKAPTASDETIGELAFNADGTAYPNGKVFNAEKLTELYNAILNDSNGTLDEVGTLINTKGSAKLGSGVTTKALNAADFRDPSAGGKDIYVTLGNIQWEVVYLTTNKSGEIILDLYQATSDEVSTFSGGSGYTDNYKNSYSNISHIYGTSYMRAVKLGNGGTYYTYSSAGQKSAGTPASATPGGGTWGKFASGNFSSYLDAPANVDYQEKEGLVELKGQTGPNYDIAYNYPNEAYGTPTYENYFLGTVSSTNTSYTNMNTNYSDHACDTISKTGATVSVPSNHKDGYEAWQTDKVWLPSQSEAQDGGIWGLSNAQRANITSSKTSVINPGVTEKGYSWVRTAARNSCYDIFCLNGTGTISYSYSSAKLAIRPAIHLNLTKAEAASATKLTTPSGTVTADYTGSPLTVNDAKTVPDWYKHLIYTDPDALTLSYVKDGSTVSSIIDAGTYTVTVKLGSSYMWTDNTTSDKTFTYTVNKKKLTINWTTDDNDYQVAEFADTSEIKSRDSGDKYPKLVTKYYDASGSPNALVDAPTGLGSWVAVAKLENADGCNYAVDDTKPFSVSKKQLDYPVLTSGSASEEYDGNPQEFTFSGYDPETMSFTAPTGADSFDGNTLKVTNAGSYAVSYTLKNSDLYEWSGTAPSAVTITPKSVVISSDSANPSEWEKKTKTDLKFKVPTALCPGDSKLNLVAVYSLNGGADQTVAGAIAFDGTDTYTVTIGSGFAKGNYALTVKVADGENYAGSCTHNFAITAQGISLGSTDIKWTINGKVYVIEDYDDPDEYAEIEYTGQNITEISANFDSASDAAYLIQDGAIGGDWSTAVDVGDSYTAVLTVKANGDYAFSDGPFTLKIKIVPKVLDFTNAEFEWQYAGDGDSWNAYSASNKPSVNDGKAVSVRISPTYLAGLGLSASDYTDSYINHNTMTDQGAKSTTATITITNGNYTTADKTGVENITFNWEITAQALEYSWTGTQNVTVNTATGEKAFEFPAIEFADGQAHSDYFYYFFTVDGTDYSKEALEQFIGEKWDETKPAITGSVKVVLKDGVTEVTLRPASGNASSAMFTTGTPKTAITVAITGNGSQYGKVGFTVSVIRNTVNESARTTVTVSGGTLEEDKTFDASDSALVEFVNGLGAGSYKITVSLNAGEEDSYTLVGDYDVEFVIVKQKVELPALKEVVFDGSTIYFKDCINGFDDKLMKILGVDDGGIDYGREWRENGYYTKIVLLDGDNYEFVKTTVNDGGNAPVKYALTDGEATVETLGSEYEYNWMIKKFLITKEMWNMSGKKGAEIDLPSQFDNLIKNPEVLKITYQYYNDEHSEALKEGEYSFKGGNSYFVSATLSGSDADNFEFENNTLTSDRAVYKVQQSKAEEVLNNTLGFVKNNLALVIGCAVGLLLLILLIIIIAVVAKKKKKREAELKEEKRLEREERMMRMQMGGGQMPITAAGMIAAQQAMPAQQQQFVPQPAPVQQQTMPAPVQAQVQQATPTAMPAPVQQPAPAVAPNSNGGASVDISALEERLRRAEDRARYAEERMSRDAEERTRAAEERVLRATEERARLAEEQLMRNAYMNRTPVAGAENGNIQLDALGALVLAALKNYAGGERPEQVAAPEQQQIEAGSATMPAVYPPDAVVTTTTTVDTTSRKADKADRREITENRDRGGDMDIDDVDGFYDEA